MNSMQTGYVYDERMAEHFNPFEPHPEQPERIKAIYGAMTDDGLVGRCMRIPALHATADQICAVHTAPYFSSVIEASRSEDEEAMHKFSKRFNSIYFNRFSLDAALLAAGGTVQLALAIMQRKVNNGFAVVRPPGHHAESHCAMGFCLFNNVAVAVKEVQKQFGRTKILILDWDIHHGNGTQQIFLADPDVLYISIHRYENGSFYPHSPEANHTQVGVGRGVGRTVNIPWPDCGMGDADYLHAFHRVVMPIAHEFKPDLVIVSAGFDAAVGDPIGECMVTPDGFAHMTHLLRGLAGGRMMLVLEGGYDLDSLSLGAVACIRVLLGESPGALDACVPSEVAVETAIEVIKSHTKHWRCFADAYADERFQSSLNPTATPKTLSLAAPLIYYWSHLLESFPGVLRLPMTNALLRRFERHLHLSEDALQSPEVLIFFIHGEPRCRSSNSITNAVASSNTIMSLGFLDYVQDFRDSNYAIVDLTLSTEEILECNSVLEDAANGNELASVITYFTDVQGNQYPVTIIENFLLYIWDKICVLSRAKNIFIVAADDTCKFVRNFLAMRAIEESTLRAVVMLHPETQPQPCPRSKALWLYEVSVAAFLSAE